MALLWRTHPLVSTSTHACDYGPGNVLASRNRARTDPLRQIKEVDYGVIPTGGEIPARVYFHQLTMDSGAIVSVPPPRI